MKRKAIIIGIRGSKLTAEERYLLKTQKPWGIILFSRNIKNLIQLKFLINDIRKSIKDKNYPILIDQEGGRISRLNKINTIIVNRSNKNSCGIKVIFLIKNTK